MTSFSPSNPLAAADRHLASEEAASTAERRRPWAALLVSAAALAWSGLELVNLAARHTTGAELYGVVVALLAATAGVLNLVLLAGRRQPTWAVAGLLILWGLIALGGVAGSVAHIVGPVEGYGPIDPRPRPILAPLVFSALGIVGAAAVVVGRRGRRSGGAA
jgi:hypothetical protein